MLPNAMQKSEKGQVLLIVVLAAVISLTVGLSAVSRSVTNTRVSTEESNSQKALSAAEAGIEEQINKSNITAGIPNKSLSNNSSFSTSAQAVRGTRILINNGEAINQDEGADVWLSNYPNFTSPVSTSLVVYWKDSSGGSNCATTDPAIEIAVISGGAGASRTNPIMNRYAVDGCPARRGSSNHFSAPSGGAIPAALSQFNRRYVVPGGVIQNGFIARIIPLYARASVAVESTASLPPQGYVINSTGKSGDTVRQVRVYQGFPTLPVEFFPYNLFLP